ncbi:MAG: aromatic ring-hydroxylating dioxygenase subunit alpha [Rhodobacteraceae bacterium]|nr:aromatic ring-hydroxylating dioxygenase subunit alpha [Paracoccaceae bacterium]MCY4198125.1 aromatic ring-hydroxylating dioxygenase subunit alpha [Paracoccaceae bacterium]
MTRTTIDQPEMRIDPFTYAHWYALGRKEDFPEGCALNTRLLSHSIGIRRDTDIMSITGPQGRALPIQHRYGHVWTSLSDSPRPLFDIPEFAEPGRRLVTVGGVRVRCSGLRAVENFLDMAHFPFVHTDILGVTEHAEVKKYDVKMDVEKDEIWATQCQFFQPVAAAASVAGDMVHYQYRVPHPHSVILYKSCPVDPDAWDLIGLFIQPLEEEECLVHSFLLVFDDNNTDTALLHFQQNIFLQDRVILENQVPARLPLDPRQETPTRADASSIAYRRWLKRNGVTWSTTRGAEIA